VRKWGKRGKVRNVEAHYLHTSNSKLDMVTNLGFVIRGEATIVSAYSTTKAVVVGIRVQMKGGGEKRMSYMHFPVLELWHMTDKHEDIGAYALADQEVIAKLAPSLTLFIDSNI